MYHSLAELYPKIPLILAKPITQTNFSPCYFAPVDSSCLDKRNYSLRDWYFKKEWGPWLNDFWKVLFSKTLSKWLENEKLVQLGKVSYTNKFDSWRVLLVHLHLWWWSLSINLSSTTQVLNLTSSPKVGESYVSLRIDNKSKLLVFSKKRNKHTLPKVLMGRLQDQALKSKIKHLKVEKQPTSISLASFSEELLKGKVALWAALAL